MAFLWFPGNLPTAHVYAIMNTSIQPGKTPRTPFDRRCQKMIIMRIRIWIKKHAGKKAIMISAQLPYDVKRFPEADAVLLAYGSYIMREIPPASGEGSAYMPNLPAAICACFGMGEPAGNVPVSLPEIDDNYKLIVNP